MKYAQDAIELLCAAALFGGVYVLSPPWAFIIVGGLGLACSFWRRLKTRATDQSGGVL